MLNILIRMDGLVEDIQKGEADAPDVQVMSSLKWIMKEIGPGVCEHINYVRTVAFLNYQGIRSLKL
jgi:hypothetical protein